MNGKFEGIERSEKRINRLIKKYKDVFKRPVKAFVTFSTQEGIERCVKHVGTTKGIGGYPKFQKEALEFHGQKLGVQQAGEATDLIWENLEITQQSKNTRKVWIFFILTMFLILNLITFTVVKSKLNGDLMRYNPRRDCKAHA